MACEMCNAMDGILAMSTTHGYVNCFHSHDRDGFVICPACKTRRSCPNCIQKTGADIAQCATCGMKMKKYNLCRHNRIHTGRKPFGCALCERSFKTKKDLIDHLRVHYDIKPYECEACGSRFSQVGTLRRHQRRIHATQEDFSCPFCDDNYCRQDHLLEHLKKEHLEEHPYKCHWYSKAFVYREQLMDHQVVCKDVHDVCHPSEDL